uniref:hypothetical protein n=1 Tax=Thiolapillus sp. TaxID=2017437 RepID=UPI003AF43FA6
MGAFFRVCGTQELERSISAHHCATETDIRDETMQIDGVPQGAFHDLPNIAHHGTDLVDAGWGHHEGRPGIGQYHDGQTGGIQQQPQGQVHPFQVAVAECILAIVVHVEEEAFEEEHAGIHQH